MALTEKDVRLKHSAMIGTGHDVKEFARDEGALLRRQSTGSPR